MQREEHSITLLARDGAEHPAQVVLEYGDGAEGGLAAHEVRITLTWSGGLTAAVAGAFFSAFVRIREHLLRDGLTPRCYGACRNLVLSGMSADMMRGLGGYLVKLGAPRGAGPFVRIFESGPEMDLATPQEQAEYKEAWRASLRRLP